MVTGGQLQRKQDKDADSFGKAWETDSNLEQECNTVNKPLKWNVVEQRMPCKHEILMILADPLLRSKSVRLGAAGMGIER
ncbi:hypothetical protein GJ744_010719 [Endocarpon pusillum]|uniref:Uncharacterized protein n=1 Tax=Endocarpon pusillum TaxID=364733 RepID=A0A8H7ADU5_9EURO|nr:hypothetical protein GJ744_010719 [Endocarpon pusillum]